MKIQILLITLLVGCAYASPSYALVENMQHNSATNDGFFDHFNKYTYAGCNAEVNSYASTTTEINNVYTTTSSNTAKINTYWNSVKSVSGRLVSKKQYRGGLWIFDIKHIPQGTKVWPALWMMSGTPCPDHGNAWPAKGEIDIIEATYESDKSAMIQKPAIHTGGSCMEPSFWQPNVPYSGSYNEDPVACTASAGCNCATTSGPNGCWWADIRTGSFIENVNSNGGGFYALVWNSDGIKVFYWARGSEPADVTNGSPQPWNWNQNQYDTATNRQASWDFTTSCPSSRFDFLNLIIDNKLCGEKYSTGCSASSSDNYAAMSWEFNSIKMYTPISDLYYGCFTEFSSRIFSHQTTGGASNTPKACIAACRQDGYAWAGLQYSSECWCTNSQAWQNYPSTACTMACPAYSYGGVLDHCGGSWANDVYGTGV